MLVCSFYVLSLNAVPKHHGPWLVPCQGYLSVAGLFGGCAFASMSESLFCQGSAAVNGVGYAWLPTGSVCSDAIVVLLDSNTILDLWYPTNITEYLVLPLTHTNNHLLVVRNKTICLAGRFLEFPLSNAVASRLTPTTMTLTKSHYCYDLQNNH